MKLKDYFNNYFGENQSASVKRVLQSRLDEIREDGDDVECLINEVAEAIEQFDSIRLRYVTRFDQHDGFGPRRNEQINEAGRIKFLNECVNNNYEILGLLEESLY